MPEIKLEARERFAFVQAHGWIHFSLMQGTTAISDARMWRFDTLAGREITAIYEQIRGKQRYRFLASLYPDLAAPEPGRRRHHPPLLTLQAQRGH